MRRLGEVSRILTDAGMIFITALEKLDDYDLEQLRLLNYPNEVLVVNQGDVKLKKHLPDALLPEDGDLKEGLNSILKMLSNKKVIPDYYI